MAARRWRPAGRSAAARPARACSTVSSERAVWRSARASIRRCAGRGCGGGAGARLAAARARMPVNLLAERRQRLGREGRSAFALDRSMAAAQPRSAAAAARRLCPGGRSSGCASRDASSTARSASSRADRSGRDRRRRLGRGPARRIAARRRAAAVLARCRDRRRNPAPVGRMALPHRRRRPPRLRPGADPRRGFLTRPRLPPAPIPVRVASPWISICRSPACR